MRDWLTYERRNWIAVAFVAAFGGFFVGNGHTTQNSVAAIADKEAQERQQVHVLRSTLNALKPAPSKEGTPSVHHEPPASE